MLENLTDENFESEIKKIEKPVLIDFFAVWCDPCSMLAPILEKVADELEDKIVLKKVNVDEFPLTSQKFKIDRIPAVFLFQKGNPVANFTGLRPEEEIKEWVESFLK